MGTSSVSCCLAEGEPSALVPHVPHEEVSTTIFFEDSMRLIVLAIFLVCSFGFAESGAWKELSITLERTECYGPCPVYILTIKGNGSVRYEGKRHVRVVGVRYSKLDQSQIGELLKAFEDTHFFDLQDSYQTIKNPDGSESFVTDLPTTYTSIHLDGTHKAVEDYVGAPKELKQLERRIDAIVNSKRWVAIDAASVHAEAQHGWDVNAPDGQRLFMDAVRRGDVEVVHAFIEEGIDVNTPLGKVRPLQEASGAAVVKELIAAGANVNATSKEYFGPPLIHAAQLGDVESIKALLDAGAKVNACSPDGQTSVMKAAEWGNLDAVRLLLQAGGDISAHDRWGKTAFDYADYWLKREQLLEKTPGPFEEVTPNYQQRYKEIQNLLQSAGSHSAP